MIVAAEIILGDAPSTDVESAADVLDEACRSRVFRVERLAAPTQADNRLCIYLSTADGGYDVEKLLDHGVRRNAYARLDYTQYLIRSWRGQARLHIALAARSGPALCAAARWLARRIADRASFTNLDLQGPRDEAAR
ncbi:MAG: hypothetical protein GWP05_06155 [Anaerolineaceae bacterium]|nr:hypothetical protein [Anaerolineaceae bacterium]